MPRLVKGKYYDLNQTFSDEEGNRYSRRAADTLVLWMNMGSTPTDKGPKSLTTSYEGSPTTSTSAMTAGGTIRDTVTFSDSGNKNGKVAANAALSPSTLASGGTPTTSSDLPFSISFWVNFSSYPTGQGHYLFAKDTTGGYDYLGSLTTAKKLELIIRDDDNTKLQSVITSTAVDSDSVFKGLNTWNHLVFTYDGRAGNTAYAGMKIYINGVSRTVQNDGSQTGYVGIRPTHALPLYVGSFYDGTREVDGQMAEFCMWNDYALNASDVKALYNVSAHDRGTASGQLGNPVRTVLQEQDHRTGSYPTIARTGDPDFTGIFLSPYDDRQSINFVGEQLVYPTGLPANSTFISGNVATPNVLNGLTAAGTGSAGTPARRELLSPFAADNISPFDESRVYIDNDSSFYATGTASGTLSGFSQRLSSKTILVFDIGPSTGTEIAFSTGTLPNAADTTGGVNSGMAYFNWRKKKWEVLGDLITGSNIDLLNWDESIRRRGLLAFAPSGLNQNITTDDALAAYTGLPVNNFGFPFNSKYDATGSQTYSLSGSITAPFLVEKIVIEFSASFGPEYIYDNRWGPCVKQFFLLQQFELTDSGSDDSLVMSNYFSNNSLPATEGLPITQSLGKTKDLIAVGEISLIPSKSNLMGTPTKTNATWERDLNIVLTEGDGINTDMPRYLPITGTYRVEFEPRSHPKQPVLGAIPLAKSGARDTFATAGANPGASYASYKEVVGTFFGGRQFTNQSSGHSFIKSIVGTRSSGTVDTSQVGDLYLVGSGDSIPVPKVNLKDLRSPAPYILLPKSKIILGYANTPNFIANGFQSNKAGNLTERNVADATTVLSPGAGKLILFGSFLRDNLPAEPETNQPLTSVAIHEDLHFGSPVYDQFDVCPFRAMSGSYTDLIITGSLINAASGAAPPAANVRRVQGSVVNGTAGTTGSIQRFVQLIDASDTMYDSYPPNLTDVYTVTGKGLFAPGSPNLYYIVPGTPDQGFATTGIDQEWWLRSAYEISSTRFISSDFIRNPLPTYDNADDLQGTFAASPSTTIYVDSSTGFVDSLGPVIADDGNIASAAATKRATKALWGFGSNKYNAPRFPPRALGGGYEVSIRGYKYGLAGLFGLGLGARFRRDRFGQFRDMLEQRSFPATLETDALGQSINYPLEVVFKSREGQLTSPEKTHTQNLSAYASASLPYYDGLFVERDDDPDAILEPVEIEITLT